jgi:hypothetical protein
MYMGGEKCCRKCAAGLSVVMLDCIHKHPDELAQIVDVVFLQVQGHCCSLQANFQALPAVTTSQTTA